MATAAPAEIARLRHALQLRIFSLIYGEFATFLFSCLTGQSQSAVPSHDSDVCTAASPAGTGSRSGSSQPGGGSAQGY